MPFNLFRRGRGDEAREEAPEPPPDGVRQLAFDGFTEEWRLVGHMAIRGRLSDTLNRRQPIPISDVAWAPVDGSGSFTPVPGLKALDPYDLIVVAAGEGSLPETDEAHRSAMRVHKVAYDLALDAPPFRVLGTVQLFPGAEPLQLLDRSTELFVPVIDAVVLYGRLQVGDPHTRVVLVNRSYVRGIEQIDRRTLEAPRPFPGQPLGGTSWTDRSR